MTGSTDRRRPRTAKSKPPTAEADSVLRALRPLVPVIAASFGRSCEVILHDLRSPNASIIEIAGQLSQRGIGAPVNEISQWMLAHGLDVPERFNKLVRTRQGRTLKSSAVLLRDQAGKAFGVLCINIDVTDLASFRRFIVDLAGIDEVSTLATVDFSDDIAHVVETVIASEETRLRTHLNVAVREDRLTILAALNERGVLTLKRAVPRLAALFRLSRATIYNDLTQLRTSANVPS